jgi:stage IV sporulation protein FB
VIHFRLFGIPVTVLPWHWAILILFGFMSVPGSNSRDGLLLIGLFVLAGFISILIHEFGHALSGRAFGARPEVVLHGMGGVAMFPGGKFSRMQHILVTAAGPGVQLILAAIAFAVVIFAPLPDTLIRDFFWFLFFVSFFWALLNLIPVYPLDGGQIMFSILGPNRRTLALKLSIVAAVCGGLALYMVLKTIFFPIFLAFMAYENYKELNAQKF